MAKCDICGKNGKDLSLLSANHKELGHIVRASREPFRHKSNKSYSSEESFWLFEVFVCRQL